MATDQGAARRCAELRVTIAGITTAVCSREPDISLGVTGRPSSSSIRQRLQTLLSMSRGRRLRSVLARCNSTREECGSSLSRRRSARVSPLVAEVRSASVRRRRCPGLASGSSTSTAPVSRLVFPLSARLPLDELLLTNWLSLGRGVEVHACAVVDRDGSAILFAGHSGAGKTTMARQWIGQQGVSVLSDDRVVLRNIDGQIWMYGTPWHGDEPLASPARAPLARGFFLEHGPSNRFVDVAGATAVAKLFARSFPPFSSATGLGTTVTLLSEIVQQVPFVDFGFVRLAPCVYRCNLQ